MMQRATILSLRSSWVALCFLVSLGLWGQGRASLSVTVILNKPEAGGPLRLLFCPDEQAFETEQGCTLLSLETVGLTATGTFSDVPAGPCAVKVFHDINNDGQLNTSRMGWPKEPYGFSNNAPVNVGPPFNLAKITLKEGSNSMRIALR